MKGGHARTYLVVMKRVPGPPSASGGILPHTMDTLGIEALISSSSMGTGRPSELRSDSHERPNEEANEEIKLMR